MKIQRNARFSPILAAIALLATLFAVPGEMMAQQPEKSGEEEFLQMKRFAGVAVSGVTEICEGSETALKVDGEYESYLWNTGEIGRTIKVQKAGVYEVTVKTKGGCTFTTSVNVTIKPCT